MTPPDVARRNERFIQFCELPISVVTKFAAEIGVHGAQSQSENNLDYASRVWRVALQNGKSYAAVGLVMEHAGPISETHPWIIDPGPTSPLSVMSLPEALAVRLTLNGLGYPNKEQRAALQEAEAVIAAGAGQAIASFHRKFQAPDTGQPQGQSSGPDSEPSSAAAPNNPDAGGAFDSIVNAKL